MVEGLKIAPLRGGCSVLSTLNHQPSAMPSHSETVLAHAEHKLVLEGHESASELLALYKRFLKIENHRLRLKHYADGGGREIAARRAQLVDIVLKHLFEAAVLKSQTTHPQLTGLSLVAIGGYGRGE